VNPCRRRGTGSRAARPPPRPANPGAISTALSAGHLRRTDPEVKVLAEYQEDPVQVEQGRRLVAMFHQELTADSRVYQLFLDKL